MKPNLLLKYRFVEYIPDKLEDGTIYISTDFATVIHKCCCGCGREVVTPLSPTDWKLIFDGETISLSPSIGNWSFPCQSHYWITRNHVRWTMQWSKEKIANGREHDIQLKRHDYESSSSEIPSEAPKNVKKQSKSQTKENICLRVIKWFLGKSY